MNNENLFCVLALLLSTAVTNVGAQSPPSPSDPYQYANVSSSTALIIVIIMAALFLAGMFSIFIRQCTERQNGGGTAGPVVAANGGLDSAVLETFPTFAYSAVKGLKIGKGALECAVCLNEFEDDDTLRLLPKCDHVFHPVCIDAWLSSHTTCPVCRANLAVAVSDETPVTDDVIATTPPIELNDDDHRTELLQNSSDQNGDNEIQQISEPVPMDPIGTMNQNRVLKARSIKSLFFSKFARSHSTGHSLIQQGKNVDRFTLRLPEDVREQIMRQRLNRTTSLQILPTETSSRRGYRTGGGEGSSRGKSYRRLGSLEKSDWWVFSMLPPFLSKAPSANDGGEGTSSMAARGFITSLKKSFSRLNSKEKEPGLVATDSARPPV